jgi:hypothetical protein
VSLHRNFKLLLTQIFCRRLNLDPGIVRLEVGLSYDLLRFIPWSTICSHPFQYCLHWGKNLFNIFFLTLDFRFCLYTFYKVFFLGLRLRHSSIPLVWLLRSYYMYCIASQSLLTLLCRSLVCFSSPIVCTGVILSLWLWQTFSKTKCLQHLYFASI